MFADDPGIYDPFATEAVAVVGLGCRLPGARNAQEFWDNLLAGCVSVGQVGADRWDAEAFYSPDPGQPNRSVSKWGGFVDDLQHFDARFFGISPREAQRMDPQQRMMLEVCWWCLEDAGYNPLAFSGQNVGVWVGVYNYDYRELQAAQLGRVEGHTSTGTFVSLVPNRISYFFNLRGPSVSVDAACASSLVAVHEAVQSILAGQCDLALAGGVNVICSPTIHVSFSKLGMLSPEGKCKTFDADADGYVRGEGAGVVLLKRLSAALREGDQIYGIIRGSAVNHGGRTRTLTSPNVFAQAQVIQAAMRRAEIDPHTLTYVETHGTGTPLGDPIEVAGLKRAFSGSADDDIGTDGQSGYCGLGSVKPNIGHLESAAGIAGLVKVLLAMKHRVLPASVGIRRLNPRIKLDGSPFYIVERVQPWKQLTDRRGRPWPRRAGVSSFGFGGVNAHVIVQEPPEIESSLGRRGSESGSARTDLNSSPRATACEAGDAPHVLAISGRDHSALRQVAGQYACYLEKHSTTDLADVCYTANTGRAHFEHRAAIVAESSEAVMAGLRKVVAGRSSRRVQTATRTPRVAFLFTGQGAQYVAMGRQLYQHEPIFRQTLDHCAEIVAAELPRPLVEVMWHDPNALRETLYAQPALFSLQVALTSLWHSWGVEPDAVLGHSAGEYAAAVAAGVMNLEDGLRLIAHRGRLMQGMPAAGAMAAVMADDGDVVEALRKFPQLSVAAYNGSNTVLSGPVAALQNALDRFSAASIESHRLPVSRAFHSCHVDPLLEELESAAADTPMQHPQVTWICNLTGKPFSAKGPPESSYWRHQARRPVQFAQAVDSLAEAECQVLLEIGPAPVLAGMALRCWREASAAPQAVTSLRPGRAEAWQTRQALASLYMAGVTPDFAAVHAPARRRKLSLPTYPFQRKRYWLEGVPPTSRTDKHATATRQLEDLAYRVVWKPVPHQPTAEATTHAFLILADDGGVAAGLQSALTDRGWPCCLVRPGRGDYAAEVRDHLLELVAVQASVLNVLDLRALDMPTSVDDKLELTGQPPCVSALELILQLVASSSSQSKPMRLWFVTRGAQMVGDQTVMAPAQASLWGLGKTVAREHPQIWGGLIDLPPEVEAPPLTDLLLETITNQDGEDLVALRDGVRWVARLQPIIDDQLTTPVLIYPSGTYLVTGGSGELGLQVAHWLVRQGARHLALLGRSAPSASAQRELNLLREAGAEIQVFRGDVGTSQEVARVINEIDEQLPPLRGLVHAAGVIDDGVLTNLNKERLALVMQSKAAGAWWLHQHTRHLPLDLFVLFSSVASVLGSAGQGNYAAANAYLDALAPYRRLLGLPAVSVSWGPWGGGMATRIGPAQRQRWRSLGLEPLETGSAFQILETVLATDDPHVAVFRANREKLGRVFSDHFGTRLLEEVRDSPPIDGTGVEEAGLLTVSKRLIDRLNAVPAAERRAVIDQHARAVVAEVLGLEPAELETRAGLQDLGMDSLLAVELRVRLQADLGSHVTLSPTVAFDHPSVEQLATHLAERLLTTDRTATNLGSQAGAAVSSPDSSFAASIAIVGMACRFPGAQDADRFWDLLRNGRDAIRETPPDRWDVDAFYDADPDAPGKMWTRWGGFLDGVDQFDPQFFRISPREAAKMDPQHRLILEVAWQALEDAAQSPTELAGSQTGVYFGISFNDYLQRMLASGPESADAYLSSGNMGSAAAGRISHLLGLQGPALAVDTACSSSLVALHLACQSLLDGETELALTGGVNLILNPLINVNLTKSRMLSPQGRCRTFDAAADGYVRSDGCGVVVLKRLADAQSAGDRILAVIRGSAINQDGHSGGLTVPNGPAQQRVIRVALERAKLTPEAIDYVETHGTGTPLGDPIEVQALAAELAQHRPPSQPLLIGGVKTNIGHLESAAGIAGLIKVVLALQHECIPPHLHLCDPNPNIAWEKLAIRVPREAKPWPHGERPRVAGVSSFGFIGTNAHVILEEAPPEIAEPTNGGKTQGGAIQGQSSQTPLLLAMSTRKPAALRELAARYKSFLESHPDVNLADFCFTANTGRAHFDHRAAIVFQARKELIERLKNVTEDRRRGVARGEFRGRPKVAFLFTGQGAQYPGMAWELYQREPVFRRTLDHCAKVLQSEVPRPLLQILFEEESALQETANTQPALCALQIALAELWRSWGVHPDAVLGHSAGEFAAAWMAGVWSLKDCLRLIARRGRLMQRMPPDGAMAAVMADAKRVVEAADRFPEVAVAALNGGHTVLSGAASALQPLLAEFTREAIDWQRLENPRAFHSAHVEPLLAELEAAARTVSMHRPQMTWISNLTGEPFDHETAPDASYWCGQARQPVQFARGVEALAQAECQVLLELGPSPVLLGMALRCWPGEASSPRTVATLRPGRSDALQLRQALASLYVAGIMPDFAALQTADKRRKLALPGYPFQRERCWFQPSVTATTATGGTPQGDSLLGTRQTSARTGEVIHTISLTKDRPAYLADHCIYGHVVVPGAMYVAMAFAAVGTPARITNLLATTPLILDDKESSEVQLILAPAEEEGERLLQVYSHCGDADRTWTLHAEGRLQLGAASAPVLHDDDDDDPLEAVRERLKPLAADELYTLYADCGLDLGPGFRAIENLWVGPHEALARLDVPSRADWDKSSDTPIHPVLCDACVQVAGAVGKSCLAKGSLFLPLYYEELSMLAPAAGQIFCHAVLRGSQSSADSNSGSRDTETYDVRLFDPRGVLIGSFRGLTLKRAPQSAFLRTLHSSISRQLYELRWLEQSGSSPRPTATRATPPGTWLLFTDRGGISSQVDDELERRCQRVVRIQRGEQYRQDSENAFFINPRRPDDMARLLQAVKVADGPPLRGLIMAWALDEIAVGGDTPPEQALQLCGGVVHLVQALLGRNDGRVADRLRLWLLTRGAQLLNDGDGVAKQAVPNLAAASLWGLGRVIVMEHPELGCTLLDLDPRTPDDPRELVDLLLTSPVEAQQARRNHRCYVPRMSLLDNTSASGPEFAAKSEATYMITGGLGALGWQAAEWLAGNGARHLVLVGRSQPRAEIRKAIERVRRGGCQVHVAAGDVSDSRQLDQLLRELRGTGPPLRGIVHAAGVVDDGMLSGQSWERLVEVMAPKVQGAWLLHEKTRDSELDFFVLYSSIASLLGLAGQSTYAAANAFLDGLSHYRRVGELPSLTVNWGPWSGKGMADAEEVRDRLSSRGLLPLQSDQALAGLARLLQTGAVQGSVMRVDWKRIEGAFKRQEPPAVLRGWVQREANIDKAVSLQQRMQNVPLADRYPILMGFLQTELRELLSLQEDPVMHKSFFNMGMDSLTAVEFRNRLDLLLDLEAALPATLAFEHTTLESLAQVLLEQYLPCEASPSAADRSERRGDLDKFAQHLRDLSDEELDQLLNAQLTGDNDAAEE